MTVSTEKAISNLNDFSAAFADLATQVANDPKADAITKIKALNQCVSPILRVRADQRATMRDFARMGLKPNGEVGALAFGIEAEKEPEAPATPPAAA